MDETEAKADGEDEEVDKEDDLEDRADDAEADVEAEIGSENKNERGKETEAQLVQTRLRGRKINRQGVTARRSEVRGISPPGWRGKDEGMNQRDAIAGMEGGPG